MGKTLKFVPVNNSSLKVVVNSDSTSSNDTEPALFCVDSAGHKLVELAEKQRV